MLRTFLCRPTLFLTGSCGVGVCPRSVSSHPERLAPMPTRSVRLSIRSDPPRHPSLRPCHPRGTPFLRGPRHDGLASCDERASRRPKPRATPTTSRAGSETSMADSRSKKRPNRVFRRRNRIHFRRRRPIPLWHSVRTAVASEPVERPGKRSLSRPANPHPACRFLFLTTLLRARPWTPFAFSTWAQYSSRGTAVG